MKRLTISLPEPCMADIRTAARVFGMTPERMATGLLVSLVHRMSGRPLARRSRSVNAVNAPRVTVKGRKGRPRSG
jgi:hypothetical protein